VKGVYSEGRPSEFLEGTPQRIRCLVELGFRASGMFKLVHDGSEGGSRFYTRIYQLFLTTLEHPEGELLPLCFKFVYDLRDNWADVSISRHAITELEKIWDNLDGEKEQCRQEQSGQPLDSIA